MDWIDRLIVRVLAWPGAKTYFTQDEITEGMRRITGERTVIGDLHARLTAMREKGWVLRREKAVGRRKPTLWNVTKEGVQELCRREKAG